MAAFEVIYLVAATSWILVVTTALCIGVRCMVKLRHRRRRMNRLIDGVRLPIQIGAAAVATAGTAVGVLQRLISAHGPALRLALPSPSKRR